METKEQIKILQDKVSSCKYVIHNLKPQEPEKIKGYIAKCDAILTELYKNELLELREEEFIENIRQKNMEKDKIKQESMKFDPLLTQLKAINKTAKEILSVLKERSYSSGQDSGQGKDKELPF